MKDEQLSLVVFDLETGGLNHSKHPIIEIALVPIEFKGGFKILEKKIFSSYVKPYNKLIVEESALKVNRISMKDVERDGVDIQEIVDLMILLSKSLNKEQKGKDKPVLAGHNIDNFDIEFLEDAFSYCGKDLYSFYNKSTFDTYTHCRIAFAQNEMLSSRSLQTVCDFMQIKNKSQHRALTDAYANAEMLLKFIEVMSVRARKEFLK